MYFVSKLESTWVPVSLGLEPQILVSTIQILIFAFKTSSLMSYSLFFSFVEYVAWLLSLRNAFSKEKKKSSPDSPEHENAPQLLHNLPGACNLAEA